VTGIGGFVGPTVAAALVAAGHEVHGLVRERPERPRLAALALPSGRLHSGDLEVPGAADRIVGTVQPDAVLHLAGLSFVPSAERDPLGAYRLNVGGTLAVLAAVRAGAPRARGLVVTSGDGYGAG